MQRLAAFLLCAVLLFNAIGYWVVFGAMRISIRENAEERLRASTLPLKEITLSSSDYSAGEITFEGHRYDVVRMSRINGKIHLFCLADEEETTLYSNAKAASEQESAPVSNGAAKIFTLIFSQAEAPASCLSIPAPLQLKKMNGPLQLSLYRSIDGRSATPPPRATC